MACRACGKESAGEFSFCPYCGMALVAGPAVIESPDTPHEVQPQKAIATKEPTPTAGVATDRSNKIGTYVFGAFSVIALLVSLIKGIVPIYLAEAAVWAGAAWFWHRTKTHSELAKAVVIVFAALVAIGEVIQIASQPNFRSQHIPPAIPKYAYNPPTGKYPTITGDVQRKANSGKAHLKSEPRTETHTGLEATITCDVVAYDREMYGDGDPKAIASMHEGDTVQYVGHVTVSDQEIIRVNGRRGYVSGCVDVRQSQDTWNSNESRLQSEPKSRKVAHAGLEATITCDKVVYDREMYGDGDPKAIASVHEGDTVQYVGHVTVSDQDIIRVNGRRGYVNGCVDVKQ